MYRWIEETFRPTSFTDEREYFLAQLDLSAASCERWLGHWTRSLELLSRAETLFEATVEPTTGHLETLFTRLVLSCERHDYDVVLATVPQLEEKLRFLGMETVLAKCHILKAETLKRLGRIDEARAEFEAVLKTGPVQRLHPLKGIVLGQLADCDVISGRLESAVDKIAQSLRETGLGGSVSTCHAKMIYGEAARRGGDLTTALSAYRAGCSGFASIGMVRWEAYARLTAAEVLLAMDRDHDAERELRKALPVFEEEKLVPESLAAVALLRESIRRQRPDRNALAKLITQLKRGRQDQS
jgi:tetratricopeptide (TPR) repeat protein